MDAETAGAPWIHLATNGSAGYRMFTHWYTLFLFDDGPTDLYYKRFARDRLRYVDEIVCAAGRVSRAVAAASTQLGGRGYAAAHIRRGELQYLSRRGYFADGVAAPATWISR